MGGQYCGIVGEISNLNQDVTPILYNEGLKGLSTRGYYSLVLPVLQMEKLFVEQKGTSKKYHGVRKSGKI